MNLKDSVAMVTGGASGLGEAAAREFADCGAKVALLDMDEERGNNLAEELGNNCIFIKTDVSSEESVQQAVNETVEKLGGIHAVVNCAGIGVAMKAYSSKKGPMPLDVFQKVIEINLVGTFNVIRLAVEKMANNTPNEEGERGVIINTASVAAYEGQVGQVAYSASKGGVLGMILPLAREFAAYGIRVMGIAPGVFETPMFANIPDAARQALETATPFPSRLGKPSEYGLMARQMAENPMLNGTTVRLDGALRMQ